jgi:hypothetical protein
MTSTFTTPRATRIARALALPVLASATLGLTACGGGDSGTTTSASATNGTQTQQGSGQNGAQTQQGYGQDGAGRAGGGFGGQTAAERKKLQACLKTKGVSLPTFRGPGGAPGTSTNGAPPTATNGAPPTATNGPPAGGAPGGNGGPPGGGLPGGGGGAGGAGGAGAGMTTAQREKLQAALKACGASTPTGGRQRTAPDVNSAAYRKSIEAYAACVRKNGFDLPKPNFSGKGPIFDPDEVDQTDATFKKASAACQSTLRQGQGQGGGGASGSGSGSSSSGTSTSAAGSQS